MKNNFWNNLKRLKLVLAFALLGFASSFAQGLPMGAASAGNTGVVANPLGQAPVGAGNFMNMRLPLFQGGSFGLGSGAGVGSGNNVGVCEIKPMLGAWMPGLAFVRLGYGFSSYDEKNDDDKTSEIENSNFSVDLGVHILSEFYVMGSYSRVNALSENGDVSWNEWSVGFGTFWVVFSRTFLTFDVGYHWVREHYDPFLDKNVTGGRMQVNLGFAVFVY
jgi:PPE-repeat protein